MATTAKKAGKKGGTGTVRRGGGRKAGSWTATNPDQIKSFREANNVSRAKLAGMLGVSSTSIQNWETGAAIATTKMQAKVSELMARWSEIPGQIKAVAGKPAGPALLYRTTDTDVSGGVIETAGKIVVGYLEAHGERVSSTDELVKLIRDVRMALAQ